MDKDVIQLLVMLGALISAFILLALLMQYLQRKLTKWSELSEVFPVKEIPPDTKFYKRCPGHGRWEAPR